jgi:hypothetical protein
MAETVANHPKPSVFISGHALDINGQTTVPRGLMGLHADAPLTVERAKDWGVDGFRAIQFVPGSGSVVIDAKGNLVAPFKDMEVVIDCQGDRFYPAVVLTNPKYEGYFREIGRAYAEKCKTAGWHGFAEFWNEPYLNWAERSRKNYDPKFYDVSKATDDGPVTIMGWDKPLRYLRWRRLWAQDDKGHINYLVPVPKDAKTGDTFHYELNLYFAPKGVRSYTVVEKWDVYDPTAVSFWSGKQNYDFYMWMFLPWAQAIKETNPGVTVIGGWDFPIYSDRWKAWELLYKPMIDDGIQWLDGVCEHHYGSDTRANAGTYEVVVGYALAEYGKRLRCFNTETAGCVDPSVPGNVHGQATPFGAFNYGLRDIIELWYRSPDKAHGRAAHGSLTPGWGGGGDEFLFKLLKDFRGKLIEANSSDLQVWPVAAVHETNLVVVLYNDRSTDQAVALHADAPRGTTFTRARRVAVVPISDKGPLEVREELLAASGAAFDGTVTVRAKTGVKLVFDLDKAAAGLPVLQRRQFFAKGVLDPVTPEKPVTRKISLPPELLAKARSARLRVVLERVNGGEARAVVNGTTVPVPDHDWLTEIDVPVETLRADNTLVFESAGDGYQLDIASLVLDIPSP